jgi:hypothetical protein
MNQTNSRILTPRRIVIFFCVILGLLHVILLGWTLQRNQAASQLTEDILILQENLDQLQEINQDQLDDLQEELSAILADVSSLEASFPELGAPFALYRRGLGLAQDNQVELLEITLTGSESVDTMSGKILRNQFNIETSGSLVNCLSFLDALERAGQDTIILEFANFKPGQNQCSLEISTLGFPAD